MEYSTELVQRLKKQNLTVFEDIYYMKVEVSHVCNRKCDFCGISHRESGYMTKETFTNLLNGAGPSLRRIDLSLQGEPTLNPLLPEFVSMIREIHPECQIMLISNMDKIRKEGAQYMFDLYDRGLNIIQADLYDEKQQIWFMDMLGYYTWQFLNKGIIIHDCYVDDSNPFKYTGPRKEFLYFLRENLTEDENQPLSTSKNHARNFHTWGGNLPLAKWDKYTGLSLTDLPMEKKCTEPLKYATIRYNGQVAPCCFDGACTTTLGDVNDTPINEIWKGRNFQVVRALVTMGRRDILLPCILCNRASFRIGLNPYWGRAYTWEEVYATLEKIQVLPKVEPLYENLKELSKHKELQAHILKMIGELQ